MVELVLSVALALAGAGWIATYLMGRDAQREARALRVELNVAQASYAEVLLRENRRAHLTRVGEREAAAMFLEKMEKGDWAKWVREGHHLQALGASEARALN